MMGEAIVFEAPPPPRSRLYNITKLTNPCSLHCPQLTSLDQAVTHGQIGDIADVLLVMVEPNEERTPDAHQRVSSSTLS
jgi:hypothetical protein